MANKIYFLTSEIVPFAENYFLSEFSKEVPTVFNERKYDFRLMMPKYNFISERRYILREVIRLREIKFELKGEEVVASVKSAFIPNTRVQVYFLEHDSLFNVPQTDLYSVQNSSTNEERCAYLGLAALRTLEHLCWQPEVIICNDWQAALVPYFLKNNFNDNEYYQGIKTLLILHSYSPKQKLSAQIFKSLQVGLGSRQDEDIIDVSLLGAQHAHGILIINPPGENIIAKYEEDQTFKQLLEEKKDRVFKYEMKEKNTDNWVELTDLINGIFDKL